MVELAKSGPSIPYWNKYGAKSDDPVLEANIDLGFKKLVDSLSPENLAFSKSKFRFSELSNTNNAIELQSQKPRGKLEEIKLRIDNAFRRYFGNGTVKKFTEANIASNLKYAKNIIQQLRESNNLSNSKPNDFLNLNSVSHNDENSNSPASARSSENLSSDSTANLLAIESELTNNDGSDINNLSQLKLTPARIDRLLEILNNVETTFSKYLGTKGNAEDKERLNEIRALLDLQRLDNDHVTIQHDLQQYFNDDSGANSITVLTSQNINLSLTTCENKIEELLNKGQNTLTPEISDKFSLLLNQLEVKFRNTAPNNINKTLLNNIRNLLDSYNKSIPINQSVQQYFSNNENSPSNLNSKNLSQSLINCETNISDLLTNSPTTLSPDQIGKINQILDNIEKKFTKILNNDNKDKIANIKKLLDSSSKHIPLDDSIREYFNNNQPLHINPNNISQWLKDCEITFNDRIRANETSNQPQGFLTIEQTQQFNRLFNDINTKFYQYFKTNTGIEDKQRLARIQDKFSQLCTIHVVEIDESLKTCFNTGNNQVPLRIDSRNIKDLLQQCLERIKLLNQNTESLSHKQIINLRMLLNNVQKHASTLNDQTIINLLIDIRSTLHLCIPQIEFNIAENRMESIPSGISVENNIINLNKDNVIQYLEGYNTMLMSLISSGKKLPPQEFIASYNLLNLIDENFSKNDRFRKSIDLNAYQRALNTVKNILVRMYNQQQANASTPLTLDDIFKQQLEQSIHQQAPQKLDELIESFNILIGNNTIEDGNDIKNLKTPSWTLI
ncbi:MAG: hypothetical protein KBD37_08815 [Burkholderiales bacterium]|nr:hypothetical protein [Burkholderiales bacterium]